ncbi:hypothetical protein ACP70R_015086 [Stipagrostis hirtigluma subsp. patula]
MVAPGGGVSTRTVHVGGDAVQTTVTSRGDVVRQWVQTTWWRLRRRSGGDRVVGMGVQWHPLSRALPAGAEPRPCTLQLCAGNRCLVFQVGQAGAIPAVLRRFLADGGVTFAGYNVAYDCRVLRAHHGLVVASTLELHGAWGMGNASMARMAERLLGITGEEKDREVRRSRWGVRKLSMEQVRYACVDAYLSCRLGEHIRAGDRASEMTDDEEDDYLSCRVVGDRIRAGDKAREITDDEDDDYDRGYYDDYVDRFVGLLELR